MVDQSGDSVLMSLPSLPRTSWWPKGNLGVLYYASVAEEPRLAPFRFEPREPLRLRIDLDRSIFEALANHRQGLTQWVPPTRGDSTSVARSARRGAVAVRRAAAYELERVNSW